MFEFEERVIRAARRWAAMADLDFDDMTKVNEGIVDELLDAVRAYEKRMRRRPLRVSPRDPNQKEKRRT